MANQESPHGLDGPEPKPPVAPERQANSKAPQPVAGGVSAEGRRLLSNPHLIAWCLHCSRAASAAVTLVGCFVLIGWMFNSTVLKSILPGLPPMTVTTALGLILASLSLWMLSPQFVRSKFQNRQRRLGQVCASAVVLVGSITLIQYLLPPVGLLVIKDTALGWSSPQTALNFVLVGLALLLLDVETKRGHRPAQFLALMGALVSLLALVGYAYRVAFLYGISPSAGMALHTAALFLLLIAGILSARPNQGWMALLNPQPASNRLTAHYVAALSTVALLSILGQVLVQGVLMQESSDSHVVNLAGRQRMLSQKLSKAALALEPAAAPGGRQEHVEELRDVVTLWERSQAGLQRGDAELGLPGTNSAEVTRLFSKIDPHFESMLHAAKRLIAAVDPERADSSGAPDPSLLVEKILVEEGAFLRGMNEIVFQYDREADARIRRLKQVELTLLGTTLIVLLLIGLLLFRPTARTIRQNISDLERAEEELRKAHDGLELQVTERTAELAVANQQLEMELGERKQAEAALQASEARFRGMFEGAAIGVVLSDPAGRIVESNTAMEGMFGYSEEEFRHLRFLDFTHPDDIEVSQRLFKELVTGQRDLFQIEKRYVRKDGSCIWGHLTVSSVRDVDGKLAYAIGMVEDVTEQKRAEEELRQSEEKLRQAQKMEAVGRLSGGMAHDFNNLLMVIRGYNEMLLNRLKENDPLRPNAEEIQKAADRAASLTRQLLAFSRRQVLEPKALDMNVLVDEVKKMLLRLIGEDIELTTLLDPELGRVRADPSQLQQLILNLAVNARDAMPRGGTLILSTSNVELDDTFVHQHSEVAPGRYVLLAVSDTGCGMSQETQAHAFEPFFTTKEKDKGTGLGLSTVYGIVKQSGGYIWVESELGLGTAFKIYLPRLEATEEEAKREKIIAPPLRGSETILVVEDEMSVRRLARQFLEEYGYSVLEAIDGNEAVQVSGQHRGPIHLLLTDIVMPGMSGHELAKRLVSQRPETKVLYISGYSENSGASDGVVDPAAVVLQKPFSLEALARKVREVLETPKEQYTSQRSVPPRPATTSNPVT